MWPTINYSKLRDDKEEFDCILDRVEKFLNMLDGKVEIIETADSALNQEFGGIIDFLYEAGDFYFDNKNHFGKRFINISDRLWEMGISPCEFLSLITLFCYKTNF